MEILQVETQFLRDIIRNVKVLIDQKLNKSFPLRTLQQPQFYPPKKIFPNFLLSYYEYSRLWKYCFLHQVLVITLTNENLKVLKLFLNKILIADCEPSKALLGDFGNSILTNYFID